MTPDQIIQLRHLLDRAIVRLSVTDTESECVIRQAYALLPCPTCNDSGRVPTFDQASGLADADPCPDCIDGKILKVIDGHIITAEDIPCPTCNGTKKMPEYKVENGKSMSQNCLHRPECAINTISSIRKCTCDGPKAMPCPDCK